MVFAVLIFGRVAVMEHPSSLLVLTPEGYQTPKHPVASGQLLHDHLEAALFEHLPQEAIDLMTCKPIKELIRRRVVWFPSPRHDSEDAFLTELRVSDERGLFPVYFDRLPASDAVSSVGGVQITIPASSLRPGT